MATEIPPHNLREVCDGLIRLIDDPEVDRRSTDRDHSRARLPHRRYHLRPAGSSSTAIGPAGARSRSAPAPTSVKRASERRSSSMKFPTSRRATGCTSRSANWSRTNASRAIADVRDESSARGGEPVRLVVYLKRDCRPGTRPQSALPVLAAAKDGQHHSAGARSTAGRRSLNLKQMLEEFLRHRVQGHSPAHRIPAARGQAAGAHPRRAAHRHFVIGRGDRRFAGRRPAGPKRRNACRTGSRFRRPHERALGNEHFTALQREIGVQAVYRMTEAQAEAVVRLQLGQLAALERDEIFKEYNRLRQQITGYEELLATRGTSSLSSGPIWWRCATSTATNAARRSSMRSGDRSSR